MQHLRGFGTMQWYANRCFTLRYVAWNGPFVMWTDCPAYRGVSWPIPAAWLWTGQNQHHERLQTTCTQGT